MKIPVFIESPSRQARSTKVKLTGVRSDGKALSCREAVLTLTKERPATASELAARSGLAVTTCWRWTNRLHDMGLIHVSEWNRANKGGAYVATFACGPGEDAKKPAARNHRPDDEMTMRRKRAIKQAKLDLAHETTLEDAIKRKRLEALQQPVSRDPFVAALFGPAPIKQIGVES